MTENTDEFRDPDTIKKKPEIKILKKIISQKMRGNTVIRYIEDTNYAPFVGSTGYGIGIE